MVWTTAFVLACVAQDETQSSKLSTGLELTLPRVWKSVEVKSKMRLAQFTVQEKQKGPAEAELVVYYFGKKEVGSVDANIDRWVGQFKDAKREEAKIEKLSDPMEITVFDLSGTYVAETRPGSGERVNQPDSRMLAAVICTPNGPHYLKLVGPAATVGDWEKEFRAMVSRVRFVEK